MSTNDSGGSRSVQLMLFMKHKSRLSKKNTSPPNISTKKFNFNYGRRDIFHIQNRLRSPSVPLSRRELTLSLPLTRICVNISTVYNDTLVGKGLMQVS